MKFSSTFLALAAFGQAAYAVTIKTWSTKDCSGPAIGEEAQVQPYVDNS